MMQRRFADMAVWIVYFSWILRYSEFLPGGHPFKLCFSNIHEVLTEGKIDKEAIRGSADHVDESSMKRKALPICSPMSNGDGR